MSIYLKYYFWLIAISSLCFILERINPWRQNQAVLRDGIEQDLLWLTFNQQFFGWMLAKAALLTLPWLNSLVFFLNLPALESLALLSDKPLWIQFVAIFVLKDFIDWNIHRLFHKVPWLWNFHKLHHSIEQLDWVSTFRIHWMETILYKTISYLPLVIMGADKSVIFAIVVVATLTQELIHSNWKFHLGPLNFIFVSSRFHRWHHDIKLHGKGGQNFAISLTLWDWIFKTAYFPKNQERPEKLGFKGMKNYPKTFFSRLAYPFIKPRK